jgi:hypothetical protein
MIWWIVYVVYSLLGVFAITWYWTKHLSVTYCEFVGLLILGFIPMWPFIWWVWFWKDLDWECPVLFEERGK